MVTYVKNLFCGGGHLGFLIDPKINNFVNGHPMNILIKFTFNWFSGFREE
jgi:hypothetical protein